MDMGKECPTHDKGFSYSTPPRPAQQTQIGFHFVSVLTVEYVRRCV
jgi:hypothetical protein